MSIGTRIRSRRTELGWTQERLSRECGVLSSNQISCLEHDKGEIKAVDLAAVAVAMKTTCDELLQDHMRQPVLFGDSDFIRRFFPYGFGPPEKKLLDALAEYAGRISDRKDQGGIAMNREAEQSEKAEQPIPAEQAEQEQVQAEPYGLRISLPRDGLTEENISTLRQILQSKDPLIRKSLGAASLEVEATESKIIFPWFTRMPDPSEILPIAQFVTALCGRARSGKPAPQLKNYESERYTFNKFLASIGLDDLKHQELRKYLMRNLSGPVAFPDRKAQHIHSERSKLKRHARSAGENEDNTEWDEE